MVFPNDHCHYVAAAGSGICQASAVNARSTRDPGQTDMLCATATLDCTTIEGSSDVATRGVLDASVRKHEVPAIVAG